MQASRTSDGVLRYTRTRLLPTMSKSNVWAFLRASVAKVRLFKDECLHARGNAIAYRIVTTPTRVYGSQGAS